MSTSNPFGAPQGQSYGQQAPQQQQQQQPQQQFVGGLGSVLLNTAFDVAKTVISNPPPPTTTPQRVQQPPRYYQPPPAYNSAGNGNPSNYPQAQPVIYPPPPSSSQQQQGQAGPTYSQNPSSSPSFAGWRLAMGFEPTTQESVRVLNNRSAIMPSTPIQTTLGLKDSVWYCLSTKAQELRSRFPESYQYENRASCIDWEIGRTTSESLKHPLCCGCICGGHLLLRFFVGFLLGIVLAIGNALVTLVLIPYTIFSFYKSVIVRSPQIGPFLKFVFFLLFPVLAFVSPISVAIVSLFSGIFGSFSWSLRELLGLLVGGVARYATQGTACRTKAYEAYETDDGTYMELKVFHCILALIGAVVGMVFDGIVYLLLALMYAPMLLFTLVWRSWSNAFVVGDLPEVHSADQRIENDPCFQLLNCCSRSARDCCCCVQVVMSAILTVFALVGVLLFVPLSLLHGLFDGFVAGLTAGYADPRHVFSAPFRECVLFSDSIRAYIKRNTPH